MLLIILLSVQSKTTLPETTVGGLIYVLFGAL